MRALPLRRLALLAAVTLAAAAAAQPPRRISVQAVWLGGEPADRDDYDAFLACLLTGSNFQTYWGGEPALVRGPSRQLPVPAEPVVEGNAVTFLEGLIAGGEVAGPAEGATPVYLLFGGGAAVDPKACGRALVGSVNGHAVGIGLVRRSPPCWAVPGRLRNETQIGEHELAETIDLLLGHASCAGDGACEGDLACGDACANLIGLACPGAPVQSYTGCSATPVDGWVVQKLGRAGRSAPNCQRCFTCDFTPRACGDGGLSDPSCAAEAVTGPPRPAGCAAGPGATGAWALLAALGAGRGSKRAWAA